MLQYAQDAMETDKPWKRWEVASSSNMWGALCSHPSWNEAYEYRRKPRTLTYTVTIPEPMREAPEVGSIFYAPTPLSEVLTSMRAWYGDDIDVRWLKRGLCFATADDAIAAAKAMMPIKGE
jgi:hypothetical protein